MVAKVSGLSTEPVLVAAIPQQGGDVARDVRRGGVHPAPARGRDLAVGDRLEAAGAQHIPGGQVGPDPFRPDEVGVLHTQGVEDAVAQIAIQRLAGHVLDDLPERGEPVVAVHPLRPRLDLHGQAPAVVLGQAATPPIVPRGRPNRRPAEAGRRAAASNRLRRYG